MRTSISRPPEQPSGVRGPVDHGRREQIISVAEEHFRHYGYDKTTVSDLGKAIGVSGAYLYRFFDSKQAIGEAICSRTLKKLTTALDEMLDGPLPPQEKVPEFYRILVEKGLELYFTDRRLHDIVTVAVTERWSPIAQFRLDKNLMIARMIRMGRDAGVFENETPLDELVIGINSTTIAFTNPVLLGYRAADILQQDARQVAALMVKALVIPGRVSTAKVEEREVIREAEAFGVALSV